IAADGGPQVSLVWVGLEGDDIVFASLGPRRKLDNIVRDPRVSLSIEGTGTNAMGLREYLVVHGRARIVEGGGPASSSTSPPSDSAASGRGPEAPGRHRLAGRSQPLARDAERRARRDRPR